MNFVSDQLANGNRFRILTIVDVFTREALAIEVRHRLRSEDVVRVCNRLIAPSRGVSKDIRGQQQRVFGQGLRPLRLSQQRLN
jgi:hypothetical protein